MNPFYVFYHLDQRFSTLTIDVPIADKNKNWFHIVYLKFDNIISNQEIPKFNTMCILDFFKCYGTQKVWSHTQITFYGTHDEKHYWVRLISEKVRQNLLFLLSSLKISLTNWEI